MSQPHLISICLSLLGSMCPGICQGGNSSLSPLTRYNYASSSPRTSAAVSLLFALQPGPRSVTTPPALPMFLTSPPLAHPLLAWGLLRPPHASLHPFLKNNQSQLWLSKPTSREACPGQVGRLQPAIASFASFSFNLSLLKKKHKQKLD